MKFLLFVSLILLFSSSTTSELLWNDDCTESSPFLIKNVSPNAKKPYLTLGVKTNSLTGGKLSKKGKPTKNQIWTWVNCGGGDFLSNKALGEGHTGLGYFLSINGRALNVVDFNGSPSAWIYDSELGTLRDVQSKKYVRLIKRKARVALTKKLKLMKVLINTIHTTNIFHRKDPRKESLGYGSVGRLSLSIQNPVRVQTLDLDQVLAQVLILGKT